MFTKPVAIPKAALQFPLYVEMIKSSSKNAGMLQFMEDTGMVEVLHFSPGEFKDHFQTWPSKASSKTNPLKPRSENYVCATKRVILQLFSVENT